MTAAPAVDWELPAGGGDVPDLNPCIRTLVYAAADRGYEVVVLRRGWAWPST